jgi:hypothetical protein
LTQNNQRMSSNDDSIKKLRMQLEYLTDELNKTTEQIQLLEIQDEPQSRIINSDLEVESEISELIKKQNTISHDIITIKKRIQKKSAKTILKAELFILPIVVVLLFFVATNASVQPFEQDLPIKALYVNENLRGDTTLDYKYWNIVSGNSLTVNIENNAHISDEKVQVIKNSIMSSEMVKGTNSLASYSDSIDKSNYFKGWLGAIKASINTRHQIPEKFNIVRSSNGAGDIVITISTAISAEKYSGVTRTITNGNQILKAFITIYDSDKLTNNQLESIVRNQFGHALGLPHTNNPKDIMYDTINVQHPYISECDVSALVKSYNEIMPLDDFCKN